MSRPRGPLAALPLAVEALGVYLRYRLVEPLRGRPPLPRAMHYLATHRCNAHCVMCGIWKEEQAGEHDLTPDELERVLGDPLFARMRYFGMSGGEPLLRDDLGELVGAVLRSCSRLKRFSLTTNGLLPRRAEAALPELALRCRQAGVLLDVCVSVHGVGELLDRIYGVERAFARIERTTDTLTRLRAEGALTFSFNCVLLAGNLPSVRELCDWAAPRRIPVAFVVGEQRERFRTEGLEASFVAEDDRAELVAFLREVADDPAQGAPSAVKYRELADVLEGRRPRTLSCYYAMGGLLLGHDGTVYYCPHSRAVGSCRGEAPHRVYFDPDNLRYRRELERDRCPRCPPYTRTRWEIGRDLPRMVAEAVRRRALRGRPR